MIEPLHSRCTTVEFHLSKKNSGVLCQQFLQRCGHILEEENITYDESVVAELIMKHMPDWRKVINELQRYSVRGKIDSGILFTMSEINHKELISSCISCSLNSIVLIKRNFSPTTSQSGMS